MDHQTIVSELSLDEAFKLIVAEDNDTLFDFVEGLYEVDLPLID